MSFIFKSSAAAVAFALAALPCTALADANPLNSFVPVVGLAPLALDWLEIDDERRVADGLPMRFAVPSEAMVTPGNDGLWDRTEDGWLRWRMRISSRGAPHINLGFEHWNMPDSGEMTIESIDGFEGAGPFTALDNQEHGELWIPVVQGDEIMVTITCSDADRLAVEQGIAITKINIGYRGFGAEKADGVNRSGSCNVDVVCPEGDPWFMEIPCAGLYSINGWLTCSGAMLNSTAQNQTPFYLTANHCGVTTGNDQSMVFYWNYENSYCRTPGSGDSGGNGNGNLNQSTAGGAILRASGSNSDFCLVELNNDPNPNYGVSFCGWDRRSITPQQGIGIHHPNLEEKRISFDLDPLSSDGSLWRVNDWDLGTTEPGSSGSPLFSQDHRIVGQLYGGTAACNNNGYDVYGKVSVSWNAGMSTWLDNAGTGEQYIETYGTASSNGACCFGTACIYGSESACDSVGGIYQGDAVQCADVDCGADPTGGCCIGTSCYVETEADCSGTYLGDGTNCSGDPCAAPTGGCCYSTGCSVQTEDDCSGTYLGDGTSCAGDPCGSSDPALLGLSWAIVGANLVDDSSDTWTVDVYAHLSDGCRLDAVAGDANQQKMVSTTSSFYQNPYGGPTSQDVNPLLFPTFPDLEYDSFVTIGLTNSDGNAMSDIGINWTNFENGGSVDSSDGSWYVTPDDAQGDAVSFSNESCEDSNGVLIARLTTRDLNSVIMIEALFQGKDAAGATWQSSSSMSISYDDCNVQCTGDFTGDGQTDVSDLLEVIAAWGSPYDVNDLLTVIGDWGCGP